MTYEGEATSTSIVGRLDRCCCVDVYLLVRSLCISIPIQTFLILFKALLFQALYPRVVPLGSVLSDH